MKVFVTIAEHFSQPGTLIKVHATKESAVAECVDNINIMLRDHAESHGGKLQIATAANWEKRLEFLQDYHGARDCDCYIDQYPVADYRPDDGRRVIITYHTNSNSAAAKKWYRVALAMLIKEDVFLLQNWRASANGVHSMPEIVGASPTSFKDATALAKAVAETEGAPLLPGVYLGSYGKPMARA